MALDNFRRIDMRINKANYYIDTQMAKEGDYNGRELVVQITDAGEVKNQSGVSLNLGWRHDSVGNTGLDPFTVVDASKGIFKIAYPKEMLNAGLVTAVIQVVENDKITLTRNFKITVENNPIDEDTIVSENSFTILQEALVKVNDLEDNYAPRLNEVATQLAQTTNEIINVTEDIALNKSLYDHQDNVVTKTLVADDFEDFGQQWTVDGGGFKTTEGGLQGTQADVWNKAWIETNLKDKEIELVVRTLDGSSTDTKFRIAFRYDDQDNYYYFGHERPDGDRIDAVSVVNQVTGQNTLPWTTILPTVLIKLKILGNEVEVYENGVLKYSFDVDDTFSQSTKVGLFLHGTSGAVSGFRVNEIPKVKYPKNIIASVDEMLVVYDGSNLIFSDNGGKNFMKGLNIQSIGTLKYIHLFSNGNVLFADDRKCYFSHDWKTFKDSTLLDEDGSPFTATVNGTFYAHKRPSHKHIVNGKEMLVWGNYSIEGGVQFTDNIKAWYTTDFGATVKCAYTANKIDTVKCRHIHNIDYCKQGNFFIMQMGDEAYEGEDMSHWVKGIYDEVADTWTWETIGSGLNFKSTNIVFHSDGYAYYSWDLTPGGVRKVPIDSLSDVSTHILLFNTSVDCGYVLVGPSDDILVFQTSGVNAKRFYYSKDQIKFHSIPGEYPEEYNIKPTAQYNNIWPQNSDGKILAGVQSMIDYPSPINYFTRKEGHVWIDEQLSKFGFPNAMK